MNQHVDMLAATSIKNDRYVNNLSRVCCSKEVARFTGEETDDRFQQDANMLSKMSLKLKVIVPSGETILSKISRLGENVLGIG